MVTLERIKSQDNGNHGRAYFEALLEAYEPEKLHRGQIVEGEILKLEDNLAIVDVGAERDAIVPPEEMGETDEDLLDALSLGDQVPVYVTQTAAGNEELLVSLEKGQREIDWQRAADYLDSEELLPLEIIDYNKGGLLVAFGRLQGFVPNSHVPALRRIYDRQELASQKSEMVGSTLPVTVLEVNRRRQRLIMSAKAAERELRQQQLQELEKGQVVTGRVEGVVDYGAFISLGAVTGLLHISEIAWHHLDHPSEILSDGEEIEVQIQEVDLERERISLSRKALLPSPWQQFAERHEIGDLVDAEITSVVDFGAFARVPLGIEGLIHASETDVPSHIPLGDVLEAGQEVPARIVSIEPERERLGLSLQRVTSEEQINWMLSREES